MKKIYCDVCGKEIGLAENTYIHASYLYCKKCGQINRLDQENKKCGCTKFAKEQKNPIQ